MSAREQLNTIEMVWELINGTTGHLGRTDYTPQKTEISPPFDGSYFAAATPESQGISSGSLAALIRELADAEQTDMHHLLILRHGKKICECNFSPYRSGIWHATYSLCKSITGMAIGFLEAEGKVSLDEDIHKIFEERMGLLQKIFRPTITVEDLLTMQSGVDFNEMGAVSGNDWVSGFLDAPVRGTPGTVFEYNSMNSYMLSAIVTERTGRSMMEYLKPRLWEPLGIRHVFWESCPAGITKGGWGLFLCPEDAAKLGQLYLQKGVWEGKRVLPEGWVERSTSVHANPQERMGRYGYGYQIWMEERPGSYAFNGMLGQNVLVLPDLEMVVVTNAGSNELFVNCELLRILRKYFGKEFRAAERLPEDDQKRRKLEVLQRKAEGIRREQMLIRRGGWKNHCPGRRDNGSDAGWQKLAADRMFRMKDGHVGLFPLAMQVFHNNFSNGIQKMGFQWKNGKLFLLLEEGKDRHRIELGRNGAAVSVVEVNQEKYLVGATGEFAVNEDGIWVLKIGIAFLEEAMRRSLRVYFHGDQIEVHWNESPGRALIMEGLESIMSAMAGKFLSFLKENGADEMIHLLMERTIEPVVFGVPDQPEDGEKENGDGSAIESETGLKETTGAEQEPGTERSPGGTESSQEK